MNNLMWECERCGLMVPMQPKEFPIHCRCGELGTIEQAIPLTDENKNKRQNPNKMPSLPRLARNFGKALVESAKNRFRRVSKDIYDNRMRVCKKCPSDMVVLKDERPYRCSHESCGCFLVAKLLLESEECPEEHWLRVDKNERNNMEV
jgi:hypothetical protein